MNTEQIVPLIEPLPVARLEYVQQVNNLTLNFDALPTATEEFKRDITRAIRTDLKNMYYTQKKPDIIAANGGYIFYRNSYYPAMLDIANLFDKFLAMVPSVSQEGYYKITKEELHGTLKFTTYMWAASDAPASVADLLTFIGDINDVEDVNMVHLRLFSAMGSVRRSYRYDKLLETFEYLEDEAVHKFGSDAMFESNVLCIDTDEFQISYKAELVFASVGKPNIAELYPHFKLTDPMTLSAANPKYNCFVNCLMLYARNAKLRFSVIDLQRKIDFDLTKEVSLRDIEHLKSVLDFPMQIQQYTNGVCSILLDDGHAYLIRDVTKVTEPSLQRPAALALYVCIDFETVFDEDGKAIPYCMSLAVSTSIEDYDFSHKPGEGRRSAAKSIDDYYPKKDVNSYWCGLCYGFGSECLRDFKKLVSKSFVKGNELELNIFGFNNAKFDNMILLENYMQSKNTFRDIQITNNQFRYMSLYGHKIHDVLYMLSPASLEKHTKDFACKPTKKADLVSHKEINEMYFQYGKDKFFEELHKKSPDFLTYTENDTLSLLSLMSQYAKSVSFIFKDYIKKFDWISNKHTAGSQGWFIFKKSIQGKYPVDSLPEEWDKIIRDNLVGGRTQPFKLKSKANIRRNDKHNYLINKIMCGVDFCSLYAAVMSPSQPVIDVMSEDFRTYPVSSKLRQIDAPLRSGCSIIRCDIDQSNLFHKIIAVNNGDHLDWYADKVINKWITNIEYFTLLDAGAGISTYETWEFEETANDLWDAYIQPLFKFKQVQDILKENGPTCREDLIKLGVDPDQPYLPSLRAGVKLYLCAVSGKPAQANYEDSVEFVKSDEAKIRFIQNHKFGTIDFHNIADHICIATGMKRNAFDRKTAKPSYLSMFIYAKARMYGYKVLIAPPIDQIYMDTDSMYFPTSQLCEHKKLFPGLYPKSTAEKLLGMLDVEHDNIDKMWVFGKKDYAYTENDKFTAKIKGITVGDSPSWIRPQVLSCTECTKAEASTLRADLFDKFRLAANDYVYTYFGEFNDYSMAVREQEQPDGSMKYFKLILFTTLKHISPETCDFRFGAAYANFLAFSFRRHWRKSQVTSLNIIKALC